MSAPVVHHVFFRGAGLTVGREADAALLQPWPAAPRLARTRAPSALLFGDDRGLLIAAAILWLALTLWKAALAASIGVVWEEAHFVVAGLHPALAYPDIPAGWPLFARACIALFGWSPLAIRLPGLAVAQALPFAIYFLALPMTGRRNAIWAATLSMLVPPLAASGAIFYSEATMQLLLALMLGAMVRVLRGGRPAWWILVGAAAGLGLFVHYRLAVAGIGVLGFALATRGGRRLWREPGFWLAGAMAAAGLAPSVAYSLTTHAPALSYHLVGQQSWRFSLLGPVIFFAIQAAACTPVFFIGMAAGGIAAWRAGRAGDSASALLLWVGAVLFGVYALLTPFDQKVAPQWPIEAYVPLIVFLPQTLIRYADAGTGRRRWLRAGLIASGPIVAICAFVAATLWTEVGWAHPDRVPLAVRAQITSDYEPFAQFEPAIARAQAAARARFGAEPLLATSGHVEAVKLEFPGRPGRAVFALGDPRETIAHFDVFRAAIGLDRASLLARHAGAPVVILLPEPTYLYDDPDDTAFRATLCHSFSDIAPVETVEAPPGRLVMRTFIARVGGGRAGAPAPCPFLPALYIAWPKRTAILARAHALTVSGLTASTAGAASVDILLDGRIVGPARLGEGAADTTPAALAYDPDFPKLRFAFDMPAAAMTPGPHRLAIRLTTRDGAVVDGQSRLVYGAR